MYRKEIQCWKFFLFRLVHCYTNTMSNLQSTIPIHCFCPSTAIPILFSFKNHEMFPWELFELKRFWFFRLFFDYFFLKKKTTYSRKIFILLFDFFSTLFTMISKKNDLIKLLVPFKFWNQMEFNGVYKYMIIIKYMVCWLVKYCSTQNTTKHFWGFFLGLAVILDRKESVSHPFLFIV